MSNSGRSTTGGPKVPYQSRAAHVEAAKYLRLIAGRYIADKATIDEVREAMAILEGALRTRGGSTP